MKVLIVLALCSSVYSQFSQKGNDDILRVHNEMRSKIAKGQYTARGVSKPSAANMAKLKWSSSLAQSAQNYANSCPHGHSGIPDLGENLFFSQGSIGDLNQYAVTAAQMWEKEFADFGWPSVQFDQDSTTRGIGHATQMAWAKTDQIGCGAKNCGGTRAVVVCHYLKQGNYVEANIYKQGATCSKCISGKSCEQSSGLCV